MKCQPASPVSPLLERQKMKANGVSPVLEDLKVKEQDVTAGQEDKGSFGCLPSRSICLSRSLTRNARGSKVNSKKVRGGMSTGRSAWLRKASSLLEDFERCSEMESMPNSPDLKLPVLMSGKKRLLLKEQGLSSEPNPLKEIVGKVGKKFGVKPKVEKSSLLKLRCEFAITGLCDLSVQIIRVQLERSEFVSSIGAQLEQASLVALGKKPEWTLTLRTRCLSFGAVMEVIDMLSSMNLGEESRSHTYCDGWTDIRSMWKLKGLVYHCVPRDFGSQVISVRSVGTQT